MTTKHSDEQCKAVEACVGLYSAHNEGYRSTLRALVAEGIRSEEIPANEAFSDLRAAVNNPIATRAQ